MRIPKVRNAGTPIKLTNKTPIFKPKISPKIKTVGSAPNPTIRSCCG